MKAFILFLITAVIPSVGMAQTVINLNEVIVENDLHYYQGELVNGNIVGTDDSGQKLLEASFVNGLADGELTRFNEGGSIVSREIFEEGRITQRKTFHNNGVLKGDFYFQDSLLEGYQKQYHPNGELASAGNYRAGNSEGLWNFYDENGLLRMKGPFAAGEREGLWEWYDEDGNTVRDETYREGKTEFEWAKHEQMFGGPAIERPDANVLADADELKRHVTDLLWLARVQFASVQGEQIQNREATESNSAVLELTSEYPIGSGNSTIRRYKSSPAHSRLFTYWVHITPRLELETMMSNMEARMADSTLPNEYAAVMEKIVPEEWIKSYQGEGAERDVINGRIIHWEECGDFRGHKVTLEFMDDGDRPKLQVGVYDTPCPGAVNLPSRE